MQPEWRGFINRNTNLMMILVYNYFIAHGQSYMVTFAFLVTLFRNRNKPEKRGSADGATIVDSHCKKQQFDFKTTEDINKMSIKKVPKTTTNSTQWAMNNFDCWKLTRNSRVDEKIHENLFRESKFLADAVCIRN